MGAIVRCVFQGTLQACKQNEHKSCRHRKNAHGTQLAIDHLPRRIKQSYNTTSTPNKTGLQHLLQDLQVTAGHKVIHAGATSSNISRPSRPRQERKLL